MWAEFVEVFKLFFHKIEILYLCNVVVPLLGTLPVTYPSITLFYLENIKNTQKPGVLDNWPLPLMIRGVPINGTAYL